MLSMIVRSVGDSGQNGIGESIPSNQIANNKSSTYPEVTNKIFKHMTGWNSSC